MKYALSPTQAGPLTPVTERLPSSGQLHLEDETKFESNREETVWMLPRVI
ncbi:MAG: hypothetical protein JO170_00525 [Verrucomicrobia bacterium]|nr:hypothetical protein [Verrucomicrobiota bacterium]